MGSMDPIRFRGTWQQPQVIYEPGDMFCAFMVVMGLIMVYRNYF
jgi:hypothetical protein